MLTISTTFPWALGPPSETVRHAQILGTPDVCIRATDGASQYGTNNWTRARWGGSTHHDLEREAKDAGLSVSIWVVVYLNNWQGEAEAIKEAVAFYNPTAVFIDAEKKENVQNLGAFLRALGRLPKKVYLQSFRRADLHREMMWEKRYGYRDLTTGEFIIDGHGHQLYPIGWETPTQWVEQFERDIENHEQAAAAVGRPGMPWYPTLPTFVSGSFEGVSGWRPRPDAFMAAIDWMKENLGERLVGLNYWSLDRHLAQMQDLYGVVPTVELEPGVVEEPLEPEPEAEGVPLVAWAPEVDTWARTEGYNGPRPISL